jgi:hypothetical protein
MYLGARDIWVAGLRLLPIEDTSPTNENEAKMKTHNHPFEQTLISGTRAPWRAAQRGDVMRR